MNYYEHHIGDYAQATAHLSYVEDAAYSRLMRKYYAEEAPLPVDLRAVQRLVQARTEEERAAVQTILEEFFTLEADGWHQRRIDAEIARYHEKRAKKVASANTRWDRERALRPHVPTAAERSADYRQGDADASVVAANAMPASHQSPHTSHQTPHTGREAPGAAQQAPAHKSGAPAPRGAMVGSSVQETSKGTPLTATGDGLDQLATVSGTTLRAERSLPAGSGHMSPHVGSAREPQALENHSLASPAAVQSPAARKPRRTAEKFDALAARPATVSEAVWQNWCRFRAEIRKPLTRTMCAEQLRLLEGRADAEAIICRSIANGWQGLFPEKIAVAGPRTDLNAMDYGGEGDGAF